MGAREDDTLLDALAADVRSRPELTADGAARLLVAARAGDESARESLVEHSLGSVLAAAIARRDHGVEVLDLFQEGSVAATVAVQEYVGRDGSAEHLAAYVRRVVVSHLDRVLEREAAEAAEAAAVVRDTQLLEVAQVGLRRQTGHEPTTTELAAVLLWPRERVELIARLLAAARERFDEEIVEYLDDTDDGDAADGDTGDED